MEIFEKPIKLIISEIDGVLTDGTYAEDELGNILYKSFNHKDFSAINELKKYYKLVFISDDNRINYHMCQRRNLPFYWCKGAVEKHSTLLEISRKYNTSLENIIYIGAKISDKKCLQAVPHSMCPDDAGETLKNIVWAQFLIAGGKGIFVELLDLLGDNINLIKSEELS